MATRKVRDPYKGSEFGGTDGLVQPPPHDWTNRPREVLIAIHQRETLLPVGVENPNGDMRGDLLPPSTDQYKGRVPPESVQEALFTEAWESMAMEVMAALGRALRESNEDTVSDTME